MLSSAVPQPAGFAWLAQEIFADDYNGTTVTFRGQVRTNSPARPVVSGARNSPRKVTVVPR